MSVRDYIAAADDAARPERRAAILSVAREVFVRFGFKKTSMEDVAQAVGLSRQGLYLHFRTKEALFAAMARQTLEEFLSAARRRLEAEDAAIEQRLLEAYVTAHGGAAGSAMLPELIEASVKLVGELVKDFECALLADVAEAMERAGVPQRWQGFSARALAEHLSLVSIGVKHQAKSPAEYRERMQAAIRLVCRAGAPRARVSPTLDTAS